MDITLSGELLEQMISHARSVLPHESCGFLIGSGTHGKRFQAMPNSLASPTAYEIDPALLAATFRSLRETGEELVGIVHSHPRGPAEPSARDRERAFYPQAAHVIISLAEADHPQVRSYRIIDGEAYEIECRIVI
jgi:[CysO sulfur-carrier protein]-S-L-cysteine hydrolase